MIKADAARIHFAPNSRQSELASCLDEAFDITHGLFFQGQELWLCDAKPQTIERFGFRQEIMAVYTNRPKPDSRLLTVMFDALNRDEFKARVDRLIILIIYEGETQAIEDLVSREQDRVLVPISAKALCDKQRGSLFVRSILAERLGQIDLFGMSSPIQHDRYFYGRKLLVQELTSRATSRREQSGLFGLRKTGKTSVLFAVQRRLADSKNLCEYIDCQSPGIYGGRWWQFVNEIGKRLIDRAQKFGEFTDIRFVEKDSTEAASEFTRLIKTMLQSGKVEQIVLLLDEIEFITPEISNFLGSHWDQDFQPFWQCIRALSQETKGCLTFIVAGVNPALVERPSFVSGSNPIFQLATAYYLDPLTVPSVREMVRTIGKFSGLQFAEASFAYLKEIYGGHPYLIRLACSVVSSDKGPAAPNGKIQIEVIDFETARSRIQVRLTQPIKDILLSLVWWYPAEYEALRVLAEDEAFGRDYIEASPEVQQRFQRYGILNSSNRHFAILDMRDFLIKSGSDYEKVISPFKRGDIPAEVLPTIPNLEALAALFEKRTTIELGLRKLILTIFGFMTAFNDNTISQKIVSSFPQRSDKSQLFFGRRPQDAINELYLSDLKPIFVQNWTPFRPYFGQAPDRFIMNIDTINLARRYDSHSKPITETERNNFLNSYSWFENILMRIPGIL